MRFGSHPMKFGGHRMRFGGYPMMFGGHPIMFSMTFGGLVVCTSYEATLMMLGGQPLRLRYPIKFG